MPSNDPSTSAAGSICRWNGNDPRRHTKRHEGVFFLIRVVVKHMLHRAARRPEGLGWHDEAHLRGLEMCNINLTTINFFIRVSSCPFVDHMSDV